MVPEVPIHSAGSSSPLPTASMPCAESSAELHSRPAPAVAHAITGGTGSVGARPEIAAASSASHQTYRMSLSARIGARSAIASRGLIPMATPPAQIAPR